MTHICVSKLTINGSDNGLLPGWRQAIIWTNAGISLIGASQRNFNEILIEICTFSFKKIHLKMPSGKWQPFCLGVNVLTLFLHGNSLLFGNTNVEQWGRDVVPTEPGCVSPSWYTRRRRPGWWRPSWAPWWHILLLCLYVLLTSPEWEQNVIFFSKCHIIFILFSLLCKISPLQWIFSQHCG